MNKTTVYTINHILIGLILSLTLFTFKNYIWLFIGFEIMMLFLIKNPMFSLFKFLFFTSFLALFIIHNIENGFRNIQWDFIWNFWIRILYLFIFISWLLINLKTSHVLRLLKSAGVKAEIIFIVTTTLIILRRIPIKINQIFEVQKARRVISNNPIKKVADYPKIVVPLIISLFRDLDYFVTNFYLLDNYNIKNIQASNKFFANRIITVVCICCILSLAVFNLWLR